MLSCYWMIDYPFVGWRPRFLGQRVIFVGNDFGESIETGVCFAVSHS